MVLQPRGCGRVGRRRTSLKRGHPKSGGLCVISGCYFDPRPVASTAPVRGRASPQGGLGVASESVGAPRSVGRGGEVHVTHEARRSAADGPDAEPESQRGQAGRAAVPGPTELRTLPSGDPLWTFRVVVPRAAGRRVPRHRWTRWTARCGAGASPSHGGGVAGRRPGRGDRGGAPPVLPVRRTGAASRVEIEVAGGTRHSSSSDRMSTPSAGLGLERRGLLRQQPVMGDDVVDEVEVRSPASGRPRPGPALTLRRASSTEWW